MTHEVLDDALAKVADAHKAKKNVPCSMPNNTGVSNEKKATVVVGC